jgi:uncharacterized iron-regulated membrane protein
MFELLLMIMLLVMGILVWAARNKGRKARKILIVFIFDTF